MMWGTSMQREHWRGNLKGTFSSFVFIRGIQEGTFAAFLQIWGVCHICTEWVDIEVDKFWIYCPLVVMKKLTFTRDEKNRLHRSQDDGDTFPLHVFLEICQKS